ncbi:MAG TPA: hypothetical protein VHJ20_00885 [Polyangia bacterium]|nr:hypothetical protein [Polyangia bacterium]
MRATRGRTIRSWRLGRRRGRAVIKRHARRWHPSLADVSLRWESYAGQALTLWFDDVALDGARMGCL